MPHLTPLQQLAPLIERLLEEPDSQLRERLLVRSIFDAGLAAAVAIYAEGKPWIRLLGQGETRELPGADLVESVAARDLGPELPPNHLVLVAGTTPQRRALVLARTDAHEAQETQEERADLLESLLMVSTCLDSSTTSDPDQTLADRVLPPFQRQESGDRSATARVASDLRDLLRSIRARQDELDQATDALDEERMSLFEVVDRECQAAGDLLLNAFGACTESAEPAEPESMEENHWLLLFEESAARNEARLCELGRGVAVSAIDPGDVDLDVSAEVFLGLVDSMLAVVESHPLGSGEASTEIQLSLRPLHMGGRRKGRPGMQLCAEVDVDGTLERLQPRAEHSALPALRRQVRELDGKLRVVGSACIEIWLPAA